MNYISFCSFWPLHGHQGFFHCADRWCNFTHSREEYTDVLHPREWSGDEWSW